MERRIVERRVFKTSVCGEGAFSFWDISEVGRSAECFLYLPELAGFQHSI